MSQPRKAMKSLGFQGCCLRCDAPDVSGLKRCEICISNHTNVRNRMVSSSPDDKLFQHVKELFSMLSEPHKYDHDPIHRNELVYQQEIAASLSNKNEKINSNDIEKLFEKQKSSKRLLQDLGNKNPWKDNAPSPSIARMIGEETWSSEEKLDLLNYGSRTIPSKNIEKVDRSERVGEDLVLSDRIQANVKNIKDSDEFVRVKQSERKKWKDVIEDIDEILDDN